MTPLHTKTDMKKTDIDNRKDIEQLLRRFMDGLTSPEEEDRLGSYFRHADVPKEWDAYKEMFAYFDEGMPQGRYDTPRQRPRQRRAAQTHGRNPQQSHDAHPTTSTSTSRHRRRHTTPKPQPPPTRPHRKRPTALWQSNST